jgi:hypothetical protein
VRENAIEVHCLQVWKDSNETQLKNFARKFIRGDGDEKE